MVENFGGSLNLIIWIIATLGAGYYSYRCLFGTRGMIDCSEQQIVSGLQQIAWSEKMLVEGSAGLAYAAWQEDALNNKNKISAVVLCGANFDKETLSPIVNL